MADYEALKNFAAAAQSIATVASLGLGGVWVYWKFIRQVENYPHIQSAADVVFVGEQGDSWIVEFAGILENKGKVRHKIKNFDFDVNILLENDPVELRDEWGGQAHFPHEIINASFLPKNFECFILDPGIKARYSYIGTVPKKATMVLLHCRFEYLDQSGLSHSTEKIAPVPPSSSTGGTQVNS